MTTIAGRRRVVIGVDTHKDVHVAAAVDEQGRIQTTTSVLATRRGYGQLLRWARRLGEPVAFGIEGTGAYGAGLARHLQAAGQVVIEVNRPNRQLRRRRGKSDPVDAEAAARAVLSGEALGVPKAGTGPVEEIRALRVARRSALRARTQATNQMRNLLLTAPDTLRRRLEPLGTAELGRACLRLRPRGGAGDGLKVALRALAARAQALHQEIAALDGALAPLVVQAAPPALLELQGVGTDVAGALLVAAGDNPERLSSDGALAAMCGVSPVEASSGRVCRHRLNRGGNREANNALWRIVMVRMSWDPRTKAYVERRLKEGRSKKEIMRCLKRYVAREVYRCLRAPALT